MPGAAGRTVKLAFRGTIAPCKAVDLNLPPAQASSKSKVEQ
jgi:hypothetical protein